jgi:EAL domain-containing protein (putative c-di-GMP-specific phosphodiesterase class I)
VVQNVTLLSTDIDQRAQLIAPGCDVGQGFLFAKPVGADVISDLLRSAATATREREAAVMAPSTIA